MNVSVNTKTVLAAAAMGLGLAAVGLGAGIGTASADGTLPDSGTYDELLGIVDDNGVQDLLAGSYGPHGTVTSTWPGSG